MLLLTQLSSLHSCIQWGEKCSYTHSFPHYTPATTEGRNASTPTAVLTALLQPVRGENDPTSTAVLNKLLHPVRGETLLHPQLYSLNSCIQWGEKHSYTHSCPHYTPVSSEGRNAPTSTAVLTTLQHPVRGEMLLHPQLSSLHTCIQWGEKCTHYTPVASERRNAPTSTAVLITLLQPVRGEMLLHPELSSQYSCSQWGEKCSYIHSCPHYTPAPGRKNASTSTSVLTALLQPGRGEMLLHPQLSSLHSCNHWGEKCFYTHSCPYCTPAASEGRKCSYIHSCTHQTPASSAGRNTLTSTAVLITLLHLVKVEMLLTTLL